MAAVQAIHPCILTLPKLSSPYFSPPLFSSLLFSTTAASPISAGGDDHEGSSSAEVKSYARHLGAVLRGYHTHF